MNVRAFLLAAAAALLATGASASWYWPFGTNDTGKAKQPRLSKLMEPASLAIDEATDLVSEGKTEKAVEKYREALRLLEKVEAENPERAASPEFQSVRNKRAYVDAQLNAILLEEARLNAKAVAVTDTTDLEEKLRRKRAGEKERKERPKLQSQLDEYMEEARARDKKLTRAASSAKFERESEEQIKELLAKDPESRKARLLKAGLELHRKNYGSARKPVEELLAKNPEDVSALNLLGAIEAASGDYEAAEAALTKAVRANPKDYHAYYNLANLVYRRSGGEDAERAKRFYRAGRKPVKKGGPGGPKDPRLEEMFE